MSDTATLPPAGLNYISTIRQSLNFILILTPLGSVLVPLILVLFFFSTPQSRWHPVFILNILACCGGICEVVTNVALETKLILFPLQPISKELLTTVLAVSFVSPLFIDSILLLRILAFYPLSLTPNRKLLEIFALPIVVKCGRFIAVVMYICQFTHSSGTLSNVLSAAQSTWPKNPYILAEWSLQTIDNIYSTFFFLYKIYQFRQPKDEIFIIRSKSQSACSLSLHICHRLEQLYLPSDHKYCFSYLDRHQSIFYQQRICAGIQHLCCHYWRSLRYHLDSKTELEQARTWVGIRQFPARAEQ